MSTRKVIFQHQLIGNLSLQLALETSPIGQGIMGYAVEQAGRTGSDQHVYVRIKPGSTEALCWQVQPAVDAAPDEMLLFGIAAFPDESYHEGPCQISSTAFLSTRPPKENPSS